MALETEAIAMLTEILKMDDQVLEEGFDDLMKIFESGGNFEQATIEKIAYCRANNLTVDDLFEENKLAGKNLPEEFLTLSPIKQKFMIYLLSSAVRINNVIIEKGLHPIVKVRVQRLPNNERLPAYAHDEGDSGLDAFLTEDIDLQGRTTIIAKTGIKVAVPLGYELQVRPRSGLSLKIQNLFIANSPGTIDANYREEVGILLKNIGDEVISLPKGTKIAQLALAPIIKLEWVETEDINEFPTDRKGGFGSTGDK